MPATGVTLEYTSPVAFAAATDVCHVAKVAVPPPEHTLPVPLATIVAVGHTTRHAGVAKEPGGSVQVDPATPDTIL